MTKEMLIGILIPFIGTTAGSALVYFMKGALSERLEKIFVGFASGVMIAAAVWSLIIPSMEMTQMSVKWLPAVVGFLLGIAFLLILDSVIPHIHLNDEKPEGMRAQLKKTTMLVLAVTLHNIPEGMAVGIVFAGMAADNGLIPLSAALSLSIGIAIQNFPEGAVISMPLRGYGVSKNKSFLYGMISGIVEPAAAAVTIMLSGVIMPLLPYLMAFAAGAMFYVVVEELIPESQTGNHSNIGTISAAFGFVLMMMLDTALG